MTPDEQDDRSRALGALSRLRLGAAELRLMLFLIDRGGEHAANQVEMAGALNMSVRTMSRAQGLLRAKGLLAFRYDGVRTYYSVMGWWNALPAATGCRPVPGCQGGPQGWRDGPYADEIEDLLFAGKSKEAEAMMIKDFGQSTPGAT